MLHSAFAAGLRVSELISLRLDHLDGRACASIHVMGRRALIPSRDESRCCTQPLRPPDTSVPWGKRAAILILIVARPHLDCRAAAPGLWRVERGLS